MIKERDVLLCIIDLGYFHPGEGGMLVITAIDVVVGP